MIIKKPTDRNPFVRQNMRQTRNEKYFSAAGIFREREKFFVICHILIMVN